MGENFTQLGVGGLIAYLLVREVLAFVAKRKNGKNSGGKLAGELPPEYWQAEQRKAVTDVLVMIIVPILSNQTTILSEMRSAHVEMNRNLGVLLDRIVR